MEKEVILKIETKNGIKILKIRRAFTSICFYFEIWLLCRPGEIKDEDEEDMVDYTTPIAEKKKTKKNKKRY